MTLRSFCLLFSWNKNHCNEIVWRMHFFYWGKLLFVYGHGEYCHYEIYLFIALWNSFSFNTDNICLIRIMHRHNMIFFSANHHRILNKKMYFGVRFTVMIYLINFYQWIARFQNRQAIVHLLGFVNRQQHLRYRDTEMLYGNWNFYRADKWHITLQLPFIN